MDAKLTSGSQNPLLVAPIPTTLIKMTLPMILAMIMLMTFGLVDTFFVGMLGTDQLAAISFTFPITFTLISLNIGISIGTSAVVGRSLGEGKLDQAKALATSALMLSTYIVMAFAALGYWQTDRIFAWLGASESLMPYIRGYMHTWFLASVFLALPMVGNAVLRGAGDTKTPSYIMAMGGAINAVLDPLLIFGIGPFPALGIQGAAIATLISWLCGCSYILYLLAKKRQLIESRPLSMQQFLITVRPILKIGLPAAGANMLTPLSNAVLTATVAGFGAEAVAAWGVGGRLESLACIVVLAMSMSLPPFISQNYGAGQFERVKGAYKIATAFVMGWQLIIAMLMWLLAPVIAGIFSTEPEVARLIRLFLAIVPLGYGLQGVIVLTNSSFNALHHPMHALGMSIIRLFICFLPLSIVGSIWFGLSGLFWGGVGANLCAAMVAAVWFTHRLQQTASSHAQLSAAK